MQIEIRIGVEACDYDGKQREHVELTITRASLLPSRVLLRFGAVCYTVPIEELRDALYYFHEEMQR